MLKKIILLAIIALFVQSYAHADDIGFVDMRRIMTEYNEAKAIQSEIEDRIKKLEKEYQKKLTKIEKEKNEEKKQKLKETTRDEFMQDQQKLQAYGEQETAKLIGQIMEVAQSVAKEVGVDVIVEKQVIYFGGMPMTNLVLAKLNKKK